MMTAPGSALTLFDRTDVDDQGTRGLDDGKIARPDPVEPAANLVEQAADGKTVGVAHGATIRNSPMGSELMVSATRRLSVHRAG